jgi:hypothetical protein
MPTVHQFTRLFAPLINPEGLRVPTDSARPDGVVTDKERGGLKSQGDVFTHAGAEGPAAVLAPQLIAGEVPLPVKPVFEVPEPVAPAAPRVSVPLRRALPPVPAEDLATWQAAQVDYRWRGYAVKDEHPMTSVVAPFRYSEDNKVLVGYLDYGKPSDVCPPMIAVGNCKVRGSSVIWERMSTFLGGVDANQNLLTVTTRRGNGDPWFEALRPSDGETIWKMPLTPSEIGALSKMGTCNVRELSGSDLRLVTYRVQGRSGVFLLSPSFEVQELLGGALEAPARGIEGVTRLSDPRMLSEEESRVAASRWAAWESLQPKTYPPNERGPNVQGVQYIPDLPVTASKDGPAIISYTVRTANPYVGGGATLERHTMALADGGKVLWHHKGGFDGHTQAGNLVLSESGQHDYFDKSGQLRIVRPDGETIFSYKFNGSFSNFWELPGGYTWFSTTDSGHGSGGAHLFGPDGAKLYESRRDILGGFSESVPTELPPPPMPEPERPLTPAEAFANQIREAQAQLGSKQ